MSRFLVVLDVDSTLIENEVIELLAAEAGSLAEVERITFQAMNGELDFEESLRARVATLSGLRDSVFAEVGKLVEVTSGVPELIDGVRGAGGRVGVVSGGFQCKSPGNDVPRLLSANLMVAEGYFSQSPPSRRSLSSPRLVSARTVVASSARRTVLAHSH